MILGDNDSAAKSCIVSAAGLQSAAISDYDSKSSDKSEVCPCDLRKGLAQPGRMDLDAAVSFCAPLDLLNFATPVSACRTTHLLGAKPTPSHASYSTPRLI